MTVTVPKEDIGFERATGTIGAFVRGVALAGTPDSTSEILRNALHEFGVLFFTFDHFVEADEFRAFARLFGEPEGEYGLSAGDGTSAVIDSALVPMEKFRINCWHTDGTPLECPPQAAMLTPAALPDAGGDTMWASMYAAWDALSSHHQRLLDGLEVLHSTVRTKFLKQTSSAVHPVVLRDPVTNRQMLYVNS